ncbi:hypothetical protein EMIHUDRAFT_450762 [Emiliania huxleyi CCMP1516]|uniref:RRM domain-containing protein n=2 Tax=Emiliania huxleyi TaxID=2903 RepID=A0A0D3JFN3_EMIH1|nr:hypothetical protein EMIHUDRAFT_450762 [Emiliania huxleyi CCMP1516]EOD22318.1 hypothetical protein EMIHUDRAFT_450762 [Emiliania huxleyi CCMP1516]|eukprot:XP_005774747.1 hypothetical protein EMIHUDRAFT_450762 [Emiliania huxleyi CCMP1516]
MSAKPAQAKASAAILRREALALSEAVVTARQQAAHALRQPDPAYRGLAVKWRAVLVAVGERLQRGLAKYHVTAAVLEWRVRTIALLTRKAQGAQAQGLHDSICSCRCAARLFDDAERAGNAAGSVVEAVCNASYALIEPCYELYAAVQFAMKTFSNYKAYEPDPEAPEGWLIPQNVPADGPNPKLYWHDVPADVAHERIVDDPSVWLLFDSSGKLDTAARFYATLVSLPEHPSPLDVLRAFGGRLRQARRALGVEPSHLLQQEPIASRIDAEVYACIEEADFLLPGGRGCLSALANGLRPCYRLLQEAIHRLLKAKAFDENGEAVYHLAGADDQLVSERDPRNYRLIERTPERASDCDHLLLHGDSLLNHAADAASAALRPVLVEAKEAQALQYALESAEADVSRLCPEASFASAPTVADTGSGAAAGEAERAIAEAARAVAASFLQARGGSLLLSCLCTELDRMIPAWRNAGSQGGAKAKDRIEACSRGLFEVVTVGSTCTVRMVAKPSAAAAPGSSESHKRQKRLDGSAVSTSFISPGQMAAAAAWDPMRTMSLHPIHQAELAGVAQLRTAYNRYGVVRQLEFVTPHRGGRLALIEFTTVEAVSAVPCVLTVGEARLQASPLPPGAMELSALGPLLSSAVREQVSLAGGLKNMLREWVREGSRIFQLVKTVEDANGRLLARAIDGVRLRRRK